MPRAAAAALFLSLGVGLGVALALLAPPPRAPLAIEWLDSPRSLGPFSLEADAGSFNHQALRGRWTVVLFGFLNCPDICPTSLAELAMLANRLSVDASDLALAYMFVSVDPERDSAAKVSAYARHFNPAIQGATGAPEQLRRFAGDLGVQFSTSGDSDDDTVAHSITFSIVDPEGVFRGRFRPGFDAGRIAQGIAAAAR